MIKVVNAYDYRKCELPEALFDIKIHKEDIDQMMVKAAEHFLVIRDQAGEIEKGDIAAVKISSEDKFINSECERFSVGKGFFCKEIEKEIIGKKVGDTFSVIIDGNPAEVKVLWDKRRMVPELTDEMAANMGVEGVTNREEYLEYVMSELENEDKEKKQNAIWLMVSKQLAEKSEFEIDPEEIEVRFKKDLAYLREELEDDFEEYMQVQYHGKTLDESIRGLKESIEKTLKLCAIAEPMAEAEGVDWPEEEYEAMISEMVSEEYTEEEIRKSMSYDDYVKQQMESYLQEKVLEYFDDRFKTTVI